MSLRSGVFASPASAEIKQAAVVAGARDDGVIDVPAEATTLAAAVEASQDGDIIRLAAGSFDGNVTLHRAGVRVVGAGAGHTKVRGRGIGPVIQVAAPALGEVALSAITITGSGSEGSGSVGPGVLVTRGQLQLRDVSVTGNHACGIILGPEARLTMADCEVVGNRSATSGGGLRNDGGRALLVNCTFAGNRAITFGGAIYSNGGAVDLVACSFDANETTSGAFGGAVYGERARFEVLGSDFVRNESREAGGALYLREGSADIERCKFTGNLAEGAWAVYSNGGAVRVSRSQLCGDAEQLLGGDLSHTSGNSFDNSCFPDCNQNGISDADEIARGWAKDSDANGVPDECDADCNGNGIPDAYEVASGWAQDANRNGIIDSCEIRMGLVNDFDHDLVPDDVQNDAHRDVRPAAPATPAAPDQDAAPIEGSRVQEAPPARDRSAPSEPRRFINRVLR